MKYSILILSTCLVAASCLANSYYLSPLYFSKEELEKIKVVSVANELPSTGEIYPAKTKTIQEFFDRGLQLGYKDVEELEQKDRALYESWLKDIQHRDASTIFARGVFVTEDYVIFRFQFLTDSLLMISKVEGNSCILYLEDPEFIRAKAFPKDSINSLECRKTVPVIPMGIAIATGTSLLAALFFCFGFLRLEAFSKKP